MPTDRYLNRLEAALAATTRHLSQAHQAELRAQRNQLILELKRHTDWDLRRLAKSAGVNHASVGKILRATPKNQAVLDAALERAPQK